MNIRSLVDWLEPSLELDPDRLRGEVLALLPDTIPAWQGWTPSVTGDGRLGVSYQWDAHVASAPRFHVGSVTQGGALILSRQVELGPKQNYLCLTLSQLTETPAGLIDVRVDGKLLAQLDVPSRDVWATPVPRFISVKKYRGKSVKIEVEHRPPPPTWSPHQVIPAQVVTSFAQPMLAPGVTQIPRLQHFLDASAKAMLGRGKGVAHAARSGRISRTGPVDAAGNRGGPSCFTRDRPYQGGSPVDLCAEQVGGGAARRHVHDRGRQQSEDDHGPMRLELFSGRSESARSMAPVGESA